MTDSTTEYGPFGRAAHLYRAAGWRGTLPIGKLPGEKFPPPGNRNQHWTGHDAPYPSTADVASWSETHGHLNIGLRAEPGTIGLDVDHYGAKTGADTLRYLEAQYGPLPPTWVSSARPAPSGIRWYRVPNAIDGRPVNWPGEAGAFIEIIQPGHRYAVVWPSTNPHASGAEYEWRHEWGWNGDVPRPNQLAELPEAWVRGLALPYDRVSKETLGSAKAAAWWDLLR